MNFARPVVDPEGPRVAEDALDHRVARDAHAAQDLQRAVSDAGDRFGADHLAHRALVRGALAFVEQPESFAGKLDIGGLRGAVDAALARSPLAILFGVCGRYVVEKAELSVASFVWIEPSFVVCMDIDERDFADDHHADLTNHHPLYPEVGKYIADYDARKRLDVIYLNAPNID